MFNVNERKQTLAGFIAIEVANLSCSGCEFEFEDPENCGTVQCLGYKLADGKNVIFIKEDHGTEKE